MKSIKKQRRIQIISAATAALILAAGFIGYGLRDGINFFRTPAEVLAQPPSPDEVFRIGGEVALGSVERSGESVRFVVSLGGGSVPVTYTGLLPDLFDEGEDMIGLGRYRNGVFEATEILAKHDENYTPKEISDARQEAQ